MNTFKKAEEKLKSVPALRQRLKNYETARDKAIRRCGPSGIAPIDLTKPAVKSSKPEDDFSAADKIAYYENKIIETREAIDEITTVVDQLGAEQRKIIKLWYFDELPKSKIAERLYLSGTTSLYRKRSEAVQAFASIYPW